MYRPATTMHHCLTMETYKLLTVAVEQNGYRVNDYCRPLILHSLSVGSDVDGWDLLDTSC